MLKTTFVAGLRQNGITAPFVVDAPMPAHKVAGVREMIEATGAMLWMLPPYSPDLNPIEQCFAKFKARLRMAGERSIPKVELSPFGGHKLQCSERMGPVLDRQNVALLNRDVMRRDRS
jgi:hypothetical protein